MVDMKKLRKEKGLTLRELSPMIGVSASYLSLLETGKRELPVKLAKKLAEILGCKWTEFYE